MQPHLEAPGPLSPPPPELARADDLAARFPGWTALMAAQARRIAGLEQSVEALTDRMSHDPALSTALHDVLTTASAIGSAAAILTETREIEAEWRDRFHRNIHEDSQRLAASSQALVRFLEAPTVDGRAASPEEELDAWLASSDHHFAPLERALPPPPEALFAQMPGPLSEAAQALAVPILARYARDAAQMPLPEMQAAVAALGYDPMALAHRFQAPLSAVFRRLATLPRVPERGRIGLAICDSSGALSYRKPLGGFAMPRTGGGCPLWPLYQALSRPAQPIRAVLETAGREPTRYLAYAVAEPMGGQAFAPVQVFEATMLILPRDLVVLPEEPVQQVGSNCRVLPCPACQAPRLDQG
jgi:predicted transcriptional regulator